MSIIKNIFNILLNLISKLLIYLNLKSAPIYIIKDFNTYNKIFSKDITSRSHDLGLGDLFDRYLGFCLGALDNRDHKWAELKKIFKPIFKDDDNTIFVIDTVINDWNVHLNNVYHKSIENEKSISIDEKP